MSDISASDANMGNPLEQTFMQSGNSPEILPTGEPELSLEEVSAKRNAIHKIGELIVEAPENVINNLEDASVAIKNNPLGVAKGLALATIVAGELFPVTNEGFRFGAFAYAQAMTGNPVLGAAVLGGSTLLVEGAGVLAAASMMETHRSNKLINWINKKLERFVPEGSKIPVVAEAGLAMTVGSVATMAAKQMESLNVL